MQRRSFLRFFGIGAAALPIAAAAKPAPIVKIDPPSPYPVGTILPRVREVHYAASVNSGGESCGAWNHTHSFTHEGLPSHSHDIRPTGTSVARTETFITYEQWNGREWVEVPEPQFSGKVPKAGG